MREKSLTIRGEKYGIPAVMTFPDAAGVFPAVVFCHGTGADKNEVENIFGRLAAALAVRGVASMRFDFAGCGDSRADPMLLTFKNETADLDAVFDFLTRQPEIDAKRAGVLGFSQGARVMADFLGRRADRVSAAVSWSGACARGDDDVFEKWRARYYADAVKNGYALLPSTWRDDLMLPKDWFDEIRASRPLESLARYAGALLVVAGTADDLVPWTHAAEIAAAAGGTDKTVKVFDGATHIFNATDPARDVSDAVVDLTADFFEKRLNGKTV